MPDGGYSGRLSAARSQQSAPRGTPAFLRRTTLLAIVAAAAVAGFLVTGATAETQAIAQSGPELARLLRAMAGMKAVAAMALVAITCWRLATPIGPARFALYALACAAMAAGPGVIWGMAHVKAGALLLHGGLFTTAVLLWRDPALATRIEATIARRRARLRA